MFDQTAQSLRSLKCACCCSMRRKAIAKAFARSSTKWVRQFRTSWGRRIADARKLKDVCQ
jgi:hypothetical protein